MRPYSEILHLLRKAIKKTSEYLFNIRKNGEYLFIMDSSVQTSSIHTQYDKIANQVILDTVFPQLFDLLKTKEIAVISEESEIGPVLMSPGAQSVAFENISDYTGYVLVIDPICGSILFVRGIADFVLSTAIIHNKQTIMSVVYQPNLDELFYAVRGHGAYLDDISVCEKPLKPSNFDSLKHSLLSIEHEVYRTAPPFDVQDIARKAMRIRTAGTCALEMCYVADGRIDGLIKLKQAFYDYLPGSLIVEESGLQSAFVSLDGKTPILPLKKLNQKASFLLTNAKITDALSQYTKKWQ